MTSRSERGAAWLATSKSERRAQGLRWGYEVALIAVVYGGYSIVRNLFGSAAVEPAAAARNADRVLRVEAWMWLDIEDEIQAWFIDWTTFIQFWNLFYGLFHFLVTFAVLIWLYVRAPGHYRFWRRAGLIATGSAVVGYAVFPLMPPRLIGACGRYGACRPDSPFVDTVIEVGGIWSFESDTMDTLSNQYAAMPSLHIGWALWCTLALLPHLRAGWAKATAVAYPFLTLFAIVVTANHWWIDGLGGVAVVAVGVWCSRAWERRIQPDTSPSSV